MKCLYLMTTPDNRYFLPFVESIQDVVYLNRGLQYIFNTRTQILTIHSQYLLDESQIAVYYID